jgi:hypothetical protein
MPVTRNCPVRPSFEAASGLSRPVFDGSDLAYTDLFNQPLIGSYYGNLEWGIFDAVWNSQIDARVLKESGGHFLTAHLYGAELAASAKTIADLRRKEGLSYALIRGRIDLGRKVPLYHAVALKIDFEKREMYYQDPTDFRGMQANVQGVLEKSLNCDLFNLYVPQQINDWSCALYTLDNLMKFRNGASYSTRVG